MGSTWTSKGFYLEPKRVILWGQSKNPFGTLFSTSAGTYRTVAFQGQGWRALLQCIQCILKVFRPLPLFHMLLCYSLVLKWIKYIFPSSIYKQYPIMTKQKKTVFKKCLQMYYKFKTEIPYLHKYSDPLLWDSKLSSVHPVSFDHPWNVSTTWWESTCSPTAARPSMTTQQCCRPDYRQRWVRLQGGGQRLSSVVPGQQPLLPRQKNQGADCEL